MGYADTLEALEAPCSASSQPFQLPGLVGTIPSTSFGSIMALVTRGIIASWLHVGELTLYVFSGFAPLLLWLPCSSH